MPRLRDDTKYLTLPRKALSSVEIGYVTYISYQHCIEAFSVWQGLLYEVWQKNKGSMQILPTGVTHGQDFSVRTAYSISA